MENSDRAKVHRELCVCAVRRERRGCVSVSVDMGGGKTERGREGSKREKIDGGETDSEEEERERGERGVLLLLLVELKRDDDVAGGGGN